MEVELGRRLYGLGSNGEAILYHVLPLRWPSPMADSEFQPHAVICLSNRLVVGQVGGELEARDERIQGYLNQVRFL